MVKQFICLFNLIYKFMGKSITIFDFFSKDKIQFILVVNIDDIALPTLNINILIFENSQTKFLKTLLV